MDKLIFHSSRQQCLITFSFDTILRRLMRFSTHVDFPQEERARERERERRDEKNSLVPLSIIERRVFGWLNLPRVRQRRTVKKGIIIREKKDLPLIPSFIPSVEKQMGHGRRRKKKMAEEKDTSPLGNKNGNERSWSKKMAAPWQTITKHWCRI